MPASPSAEPTDYDPPPPPTARLTTADGSVHHATIGSYDYGGAAADAPWLPARILPAAEIVAGERLILHVEPVEQFVRWSVVYAAGTDESGEVPHQLESGGDGVTPVHTAEFGAPPRGEWVVMVQLYFADDAGDAAYYWHVIVP